MAHLLFGADLSLALFDHRRHNDPDANSGIPFTGNLAGEDTGKKDHPAGLVDYLGALPVLETGFRAPIPPARSYASLDSAESLSTQLTLFYAGTVNASENVTEDEAQIVTSLAGNSNTLHATTASFKMPVAPSGPQLQDPMKKIQPEAQENLTATAHVSIGERLQVSIDGHAQEFASLLVPCQAMVPKALPLARKASLARFLEKRKERVRWMAPYLAKGSARDIIDQGAPHSKDSPLHMLYNDFWGDPSATELGCASRFVYGNNVDDEDENWFTIAENSRQASECGSAT